MNTNFDKNIERSVDNTADSVAHQTLEQNDAFILTKLGARLEEDIISMNNELTQMYNHIFETIHEKNQAFKTGDTEKNVKLTLELEGALRQYAKFKEQMDTTSIAIRRIDILLSRSQNDIAKSGIN